MLNSARHALRRAMDAVRGGQGVRAAKATLPYVKVVVATIPVTLFLTDWLGYPCVVRGNSMLPTLEGAPSAGDTAGAGDSKPGGDVVWLTPVHPLSAKLQALRHGEVVVLKSPDSPNKFVIKRVVALVGDVVALDRGRGPPLVIPPGQVWVEGDNPTCSHDSTHLGTVPMALIVGKVRFVLWPPSRAGRISADAPTVMRPRATLVGRSVRAKGDLKWVVEGQV
jgi:inner membrane protease subunit 2